MAGSNFVLDKGYIASGAIRKFRCVEQVTTDKEKAAETNAAGDLALGICQEEVTADDATNGRVADIRIIGISRAVANGAITIGQRLRAAVDGKVAPLAAVTANQNQVGIALTSAAADGDQIEVLLTPGGMAST